uniref:nondiscriminating glutamyl-tRNA synthetase EARS2, mitochondrial isoform X3 n=1 Tax=Myxine glutinosa TaxID=7769 RepID=UPI00358FB90E
MFDEFIGVLHEVISDWVDEACWGDVTDTFTMRTHQLFSQLAVAAADRPPRVRFAPSPTGYLHLGGLRTALYNWLLAKKLGGTFVLRLEDTDKARNFPGSEQDIEESLEWAGLSPDEGPRRGGIYGPYRQSERIEKYQETAAELEARGVAYPCFCSPRRLQLLRHEAHRRVEGDPVLLRTDGSPTYHLASVVDDAAMAISHVLRGSEWLASTSKHLQIYRVLGVAPPVFAHLPLLCNPDGSKLSKRQGAVAVQDYRVSGTPPGALLELLTLSGAGFHGPTMGRVLDEMVSDFDLSRITTNAASLDLARLPDLCKTHTARQISNDRTRRSMVHEVQDMVCQKFGLQPDEALVDRVLQLRQGHIERLRDLVADDASFLWCPVEVDTTELQRSSPHFAIICSEAQRLLEGCDWTNPKEILQRLRSLGHLQTGVSFPIAARCLRLVLSARKDGPSVADILVMLGEREGLSRIREAASR